jgi:hypothetical protein
MPCAIGFGEKNLYGQVPLEVFFRPRFLMGWLLLFKNQTNGQPRASGLQTRQWIWTILFRLQFAHYFGNLRAHFGPVKVLPWKSSAGK